MEKNLGNSALSKEELVQHVPFKSFESTYKLGDVLGKGTFGVVFKCERLSDNKQLAVKVLKASPTLSDIDECKFLSRIKDDFVLEAIDFFINTDWTEYN